MRNKDDFLFEVSKKMQVERISDRKFYKKPIIKDEQYLKFG